jgi:hypothetical protein
MKSLMAFWSRMFAELATRSTPLEFQSMTSVLLEMSLCLLFTREWGMGILLLYPSFLLQLSGSLGAN